MKVFFLQTFCKEQMCLYGELQIAVEGLLHQFQPFFQRFRVIPFVGR